MTTPRPRRPFDGDAAAHADLLADLTRVIPVTAGLAQIIGGTPADAPPDAGSEPDRVAHTRLLTDLATALRTRSGLAAILAAESVLVDVMDDLSAALDTDGGLAGILATSGSAADAVDAHADPRSPESADEPPITPSTMDDLAALHFAPADQRLHLRAGLPARAARDALRQLENIHAALARITPGPHPLDSTLDTVPMVLDRQRARIAHALTVMAQGLASYRHPRPSTTPTPQDPRVTDVLGGDVNFSHVTLQEYLSAAAENRATEETNVEEHEQPVVDNSERLSSENEDLTKLLYDLKVAHRKAGEPSFRHLAILTNRQLSASTISRMFRARTPPKWKNVAVLLRALNVPQQETARWHAQWAKAVNWNRRIFSQETGQRPVGDETKVQNTTVAEQARSVANGVGADEDRDSQIFDAQRRLAEQLAEQLEQVGVTADVEDLYRQAADRGNIDALRDLARSLTEAGDRTGAEALYRQAAERGGIDALGAFLEVQARGAAVSAPSNVLHDVAARSASLLQQTADELAALYDDLIDRPPSTAGVRLLHGCTRHVDELLPTVQQLWAALSDFCGADLRAAADVAIDGLDEVRWSDGTAGAEPTRWPAALVLDVRKHSKRVDDFPGVWEIGFGAAISPSRG